MESSSLLVSGPMRIKHSSVYELRLKECFICVMSVITSVFGNCQPEGNVQCIRSNYRADRKRRKFFGSCENRIVDAPEGMIFRYDLTSELLPYVITKELCKGAFYHIGNVVRKVGDGVQEILQCDLDYIGTYERMEKDAQCIITICNVLRELHILGSVEIRLNHCALFKGILQRCGVPEYMHADIKNILLQPCAHASDWTDLRGVCDVHMLQRYLSNWQKGGKVLLRTLEEDPELMAYPDMQRVFDDLELFLCLCEEKGVPTKQCVFQLNLVQELDYYDGLMFQVVHVPDVVGTPSFGILARGGRYDNLAKGAYPDKCLGQKFPGVGFTFVMESIVDLCYSRGTQLPSGNSSDITSITRQLLSEHKEMTTLLKKLQHNMANAASGVNQEDGQIGDKQVDIEIPLVQENVSGGGQPSDSLPLREEHVCDETCECEFESGVTRHLVQHTSISFPPSPLDSTIMEYHSPASTTNQKHISILGQEQGPRDPTEYVAEQGCSISPSVKSSSDLEPSSDIPVQSEGPSEPSELV